MGEGGELLPAVGGMCCWRLHWTVAQPQQRDSLYSGLSSAHVDLGAACVLSLDDPPPDLRATANMFPPEGRMNVCFAINALLSDVSESVIEVLKVTCVFSEKVYVCM